MNQRVAKLLETIDEKSEAIPYVHTLTGRDPGKTCVIFLGTHGNEPVGLYAYEHLMEYFAQHPLEAGTLHFIVSNPQALKNYASASTVDEQRRSRFVDINMNRMPKDHPRDSYEGRRLQEILPLMEAADIALDLHSTSLPSDPMLIPLGATEEHHLQAIPVETIVSGVGDVLGEQFLLHYAGGYPGTSCASLLVECGEHEDPKSISNALHSVEALLHLHGLHRFPVHPTPTQHAYTVVRSIFFPHSSYCLVEEFGNFAPIKEGDLIATGDGPPMFCPHDGHTLFAFQGGKPPSIAEEALFLTLPRVTRTNR
ncbi:hypothetical protein COW46_03380 [Candidatus Gracilibacteria bacterium CG17_big_fil_post_rev_8_21_14_2_50_48_13]|nr:MAG: hypothetical protein COW46_03380 [Candidatus Gracilibacteria bacterium CG17_big_fil_post_rev_8_21_14_2_50_48_13]